MIAISTITKISTHLRFLITLPSSKPNHTCSLDAPPFEPAFGWSSASHAFVLFPCFCLCLACSPDRAAHLRVGGVVVPSFIIVVVVRHVACARVSESCWPCQSGVSVCVFVCVFPPFAEELRERERERV